MAQSRWSRWFLGLLAASLLVHLYPIFTFTFAHASDRMPTKEAWEAGEEAVEPWLEQSFSRAHVLVLFWMFLAAIAALWLGITSHGRRPWLEAAILFSVNLFLVFVGDRVWFWIPENWWD